MHENIGTYDTEACRDASLSKVISILSDLKATRYFVKKLSRTDNSKNQLYFGSHLSELAFIPTGETTPSETMSNKPLVKKKGKSNIKYQSTLNLSWVDINGKVYPATNAKLIYYPQYPEVRLSGFLKASKVNIGEWMQRHKLGQALGRWLILGVSDDKAVYSYLVTPDSSLSKELEQTALIKASAVFYEITALKSKKTSRILLFEKLLEIHRLGWIAGQKLHPSGQKIEYIARNAAGYTLEAELGILPNGVATPDYLGWEVKQFGVKAFPKKGTKPVTLMTPEPNGGFYADHGASEFVRKYGYADKSGKPDRLNFGGKHQINNYCKTTNLILKFIGFDSSTNLITDANGLIGLFDHNEDLAASWSFAKLIDHWKIKHAQAVYVPSLCRTFNGKTEYMFGHNIELGTGTTFEMALGAMVKGHVYYDPATKLEFASTMKSKIKCRNQFRVVHQEIKSLYKKFEFIDIMES